MHALHFSSISISHFFLKANQKAWGGEAEDADKEKGHHTTGCQVLWVLAQDIWAKGRC